MLRFAAQHYESLRPYRWRLTKMLDACKPPYTQEYKALWAALEALDRAAAFHLTPTQLAEFKTPWMPLDHS